MYFSGVGTEEKDKSSAGGENPLAGFRGMPLRKSVIFKGTEVSFSLNLRLEGNVS